MPDSVCSGAGSRGQDDHGYHLLELRTLIRAMARDNPGWGEERIAHELLLKLGNQLSPLRYEGTYLTTLGDKHVAISTGPPS